MTDPRITHPAYAILSGVLHRQNIPGGRWTALDERETAQVLALLTGRRPYGAYPPPAQRGEVARPQAGTEGGEFVAIDPTADRTIFPHPV